MAGIAGIVVLDSHNSNQDLSNQLNSMMEGLSASKEQFSKTFSQGRFHYGVTLPMNTKPEGRYVSNRELQTDCIVDGYVFVSQQEKDILRQMYDIRDWSSDILLVPYLFDTYRNDIVNRLTGCYNLFLLDHADHVAYLFNDRMGTLPLYYCNNGGVFVFASKLESILSCGLMDKIEFDPVSFADHLCFNYTLSDETYIKGVSTLKSASLIKFDNNKFYYSQFWHIENLFTTSHFNSTESFECFAESLSQAIDRIAGQNNETLNLSLTGGWDSRIILAYMLTKYRKRLNLYSFGSENS